MNNLQFTIAFLVALYMLGLVVFYIISFLAHEKGFSLTETGFECKAKFKRWVNIVRYVWYIIWVPFLYIMRWGEITKNKFSKVNFFYDKNYNGCIKPEVDEKDRLL